MTISSGDSKGLMGCKDQQFTQINIIFLIYIDNVMLLWFKIICFG